VDFVRREAARPLVLVGPSATVWRLVNGPADYPEAYAGLRLRGALVRAQPPAGAAPERVEAVRRGLIAAGAAAVKVLPPAAGGALLPQEEHVQVPAADLGIRAVVEACAARARSRDRAAMSAVLDAALEGEGL
jgi:hypothetical protein